MFYFCLVHLVITFWSFAFVICPYSNIFPLALHANTCTTILAHPHRNHMLVCASEWTYYGNQVRTCSHLDSDVLSVGRSLVFYLLDLFCSLPFLFENLLDSRHYTKCSCFATTSFVTSDSMHTPLFFPWFSMSISTIHLHIISPIKCLLCLHSPLVMWSRRCTSYGWMINTQTSYSMWCFYL